MEYNFDEIICRKNTNSIKYDFTTERGMPKDILPLWVADMDFKSPKCVIESLCKKSQHGIFGYSENKEDYFKSVEEWFSQYHDWNIKPQWMVKTPGVVYAISTAIRALTNKCDGVLIQEPVYYPFSESIRVNERNLVINELIYNEEHKYEIDFDDFENKIKSNNVKLFILCSPHNPVGRVWTRDELIKLGDICLKYGVIILSDEIHCDFVYPGHKHVVFASLKQEFLNNTITCTSPSKTFNLAGLQISNVFIENINLRNKFSNEIQKSGYSQLSIMGLTACHAAYLGGHEWLKELKEYLYGNLKFIRDFLDDSIPYIHLVEPEGTYLVWLDFKSLHFNGPELDRLMIEKAKLWLDGGTMFGSSGDGFQRINIACPRQIIEKALFQLKDSLSSL